MHKYIYLGLSVLSLLLSLPLSLAAEETEASNEPAALREPAALAELKRATDFLVALPRFHLSVEASFDIAEPDGRRLQFERTAEIYLQRPNRFVAEAKFDDGRDRRYVYDGSQLTVVEKTKKMYAQIKAPATIDGTLDMMEGLLREPQPLADLMYSDLSHLDKNATEASVIGDSTVKGHLCKHLFFRGPNADWQVWVEQGSTPYIRKFAIHYLMAPGTPSIVAHLDSWETPKSFSADQFAFTPAPDYQKIGVFVPMPKHIEAEAKP